MPQKAKPLSPEAIAALPYRRNVGLALFNRDGLVFAGKRIDNPGDAWQMPQGGIDAGEEPRAAALRELSEEVGTDKAEIIEELPGWLTYDLPADLLQTIWGGRFRGQQQKWFALRFTGADQDIDINTRHAEFSEWAWKPLAAMPSLIVPFKRSIYEAVATGFAHLARPADGKRS